MIHLSLKTTPNFRKCMFFEEKKKTWKILRLGFVAFLVFQKKHGDFLVLQPLEMLKIIICTYINFLNNGVREKGRLINYLYKFQISKEIQFNFCVRDSGYRLLPPRASGNYRKRMGKNNVIDLSEL